MPRTIPYFRDTLSVDQGLPGLLQAAGGDTLVIGARSVTLSGLVSGFNYVIVADELTVSAGAALNVQGLGEGPAISVFAREILGAPLAVTSAGSDGPNGANGEPGESGIVTPDGHGGRPEVGPGGDGSDGGDGEDGGSGGTITIRYHIAPLAPTGSTPGGAGGRGGAGGAGGAGRPRGQRGRSGRPGKSGKAGVVDIREVEEADVWSELDAGAREWAAYRAEVAAYFFRKFDPESQLRAFEEASNALLLNPADPNALAVRDGIANRQTPSGLSRDLDIAPDFRALSANLVAEIAVVQNAFQAYVSVVTLETIAESIRDSLILMEGQLQNRVVEAQADVSLAQQDVRIAQAEVANIDLQIEDIHDQIEAIREARFSIGGVLKDVGSIAAAVAGMATGVGAIVSVAGGLATLKRVTDGIDLVQLLKWLKERPDPNSRRSEDIEEIKQLGGGFKDLIEGTNSFISFGKVMADLEHAMSLAGQDAIGRLLKQQVLLTRQKMVGQLRERQAVGRVAAAALRVGNLENEIQRVRETLAHWSADAASLNAATDLLIRSAREIVDMVTEDVFLAQRAREIYQLDRVFDLRFDFGFLHPDVDRSLTPATRASTSLVSLSGMALQVLAWDQIFENLNTAQIGFNVIHPQLSVTITDAARLSDFANGRSIDISIGLEAVPEKMFELKVNAMTLELRGATTTQSANVWVTHSGKWSMNRRTNDGVTDLLLLPRSELFAFSSGVGTLKANIPANPSSTEAGPPFSFWGRGVVTTFRLEVAQPTLIDLSQLSAMHLTIDCIGYASLAPVGLLAVREMQTEVRSSPAVMVGAAVAAVAAT